MLDTLIGLLSHPVWQGIGGLIAMGALLIPVVMRKRRTTQSISRELEAPNPTTSEKDVIKIYLYGRDEGCAVDEPAWDGRRAMNLFKNGLKDALFGLGFSSIHQWPTYGTPPTTIVRYAGVSKSSVDEIARVVTARLSRRGLEFRQLRDESILTHKEKHSVKIELGADLEDALIPVSHDEWRRTQR